MTWVQDFGLMSLLIVAAQLLRSTLTSLQNLYIPTAVLAGFLALLGGDQALDILPFHRAEGQSTSLSTYPGFLITVLFATVFLGVATRSLDPRAMFRRAGDTFFYNLGSELAQYALALLAGVTLLSLLYPQLDPSFSILLPAGFCGGHGTVTAMAQVLEEEGFEEAMTVGFTFATVGLLAGVLGGLLIVNVATRRGWTRLVQSPQELPEEMRVGFVSASPQSLGRETVSPIAAVCQSIREFRARNTVTSGELVPLRAPERPSCYSSLAKSLFSFCLCLGSACVSRWFTGPAGC